MRTQLVELKNGETFNGHLVGCDNFMNLTLKEVYQTSAVRRPPVKLHALPATWQLTLGWLFQDGETFHKLAAAYVRGNNVSRCSHSALGRPSHG